MKATTLLNAAKKRPPPEAQESIQTPAKAARSSAGASPTMPLATPMAAAKRPQRTPGSRDADTPRAAASAGAEKPQTPRSIRGAEALARSTRKSELEAPVEPEVTTPVIKSSVSDACDAWMSEPFSALLEAEDVNQKVIKKLATDLRELQGGSSCAIIVIFLLQQLNV